MTTLAPLLALKSNVLKSLAVSVGINSSGTKLELASQIVSCCCESTPFFERLQKRQDGRKGKRQVASKKKKKKVLSIDMGIRNLAMCVLEVPSYGIGKAAEKKRKTKTVAESLPKIIAWERIAIAERLKEELPPPPPVEEQTSDPIPEGAKKSRRKKKVPEPDKPTMTQVRKRPKKKIESFEPALYAKLANDFVRKLLDRFSPIDEILIERQRYRSNSASAIQEWTVRVNMFEAMLHAVFYSLHNDQSPTAKSVLPSRVTRFWIDKVGEKYLEVKKPGRRRKKGLDLGDVLSIMEENEGVEIRPRRSRAQTKLAKVSLVTEWIRRGDVVALGQEAVDIAADFITPVKGRGRARRSSDGGKLDDLADCLLQGVAWIQWEENRRSLAEGKLIPEFVPCVNPKS